MPYKISGKYVVRADTGQKMNKKPMGKARLRRYVKALWANASDVSHKEIAVRYKYGTTEGALLGWDTRGRGRKDESSGGGARRIAPVSDGLKVKGILGTSLGTGPTREAIKVIDSIHTDGNLPGIPIGQSLTLSSMGAWGAYWYDGYSSIKIDIAADCPTKMMTTAHEIGHYLDHNGFRPPGKFNSMNSPKFSGWRKAINETPEIQTWKKWQKQGYIEVNGKKYHVDDNVYKYYLDPREIWARSYSQHIASKNRSARMRSELQTEQAYILPVQWSDRSFKSVSKSIDDLMRSEEWTK